MAHFCYRGAQLAWNLLKYHETEPAARIAVMSAEPHNPLANEFLKQSVFFETKVLTHLDKGVPLDRFKVLVMPANLPKLSSEQQARLDTFAAGGGVIVRAEKSERRTADRAEAASGGPRLKRSGGIPFPSSVTPTRRLLPLGNTRISAVLLPGGVRL